MNCERNGELKDTKIEARSNHDIFYENARQRFCRQDLRKIADDFALEQDQDTAFICFAGSRHALSLVDGTVTVQAEDGIHWDRTDYTVGLTIYDILSDVKPGRHLSGTWVTIQSLPHTVQYGKQGGISLFEPYGKLFDGKREQLKKICEQMGGTPEPYADLSYRLPLFDFLPVIFEFWDSDEEFPAKVQLLWDENTQDYIKFETIYYAAFCLLEKMKTLVEAM